MSEEPDFSGTAQVTVTLDGTSHTFELPDHGDTILTKALELGLDAPFSCRGGVCTTCMAQLTEGRVHMDANYALTDGEIKSGRILCCQSHPRSGRVVLTWDI